MQTQENKSLHLSCTHGCRSVAGLVLLVTALVSEYCGVCKGLYGDTPGQTLVNHFPICDGRHLSVIGDLVSWTCPPEAAI